MLAFFWENIVRHGAKSDIFYTHPHLLRNFPTRTILVGYYWALSLIKARKKELIIGLASASLLHALFNYLIMKTGNAMFYPVIFLIIVAFFVFWDFEQMKTRSE
jgi:RsiW-degrading membrane proteinase PrsW (M82 family)